MRKSDVQMYALKMSELLIDFDVKNDDDINELINIVKSFIYCVSFAGVDDVQKKIEKKNVKKNIKKSLSKNSGLNTSS